MGIIDEIVAGYDGLRRHRPGLRRTEYRPSQRRHHGA